MEHDTTQDEIGRHWHLDKRVNVTHLIATLTLAAGMFTWAATIERRVSLNEVALQALGGYNSRQDALIERNTVSVREEFRDLRTEIRDQSQKIDRLVLLISSSSVNGKNK